MGALDFLPTFPLALGELTWAGAILLAGLACGELFRRVFGLPRITGYLLAGIVLGPGALGVLDEHMRDSARIILDIALGLVLFELGSRLDLAWIRRNPWLLATSLAESILSFLVVYLVLRGLALAPLLAAMVAAIGVGTTPSVLLAVMHEQRADGPLTEHAINLTALNSVFSVVVVTMLLANLHVEHQAGLYVLILHPAYLLAGALSLGFAASVITLALARWLGKREVLQFILLVSMIFLVVGIAISLRVSVLLALLAFGVIARNRDRARHLLPVEFGSNAQFFFVGLFVLTGAHLEWSNAVLAGVPALAFLAARFAGKLFGVMAFAPLSGLPPKKAGLLALALMPMAAVAVVLVHFTVQLYPDFGAELAGIVLSAVLVMTLIGPALVQMALTLAGEARSEAAT
ncbi:MAG: cation:proton antiporter [Burkholderiales bacterium]|nr:cation:proton antiporter [Burkholderiales bacterium]